MEKINLQAISELYAQQCGVSKKFADNFSKTFFDTIIEGLRADGVVKINGLGTFKIVDVAERESVNVNNGERIVIPGYRKIVFTASAEFSAMTIHTEKTAAAVEDDASEPVLDVQTTINAEPEEKAPEVEEPAEEYTIVFDDSLEQTDVEMPMQEIDSIDMLISTPESIEDIRQQFEQAKVQADDALALAQQAHNEMLRLKTLLQRLEANEPPVAEPKAVTEEPEEVEEPNAEIYDLAAVVPDDGSGNQTGAPGLDMEGASTDSDSEKDKKDQALRNIMKKKDADEGNHGSSRAWWIAAVVALLLIIVAAFSYIYYQHMQQGASMQEQKIQSVDTLVVVPEVVQPDTAVVEADTVAVEAQPQEPEPVAAPPVAEPARPKSHTIVEGESLTKLSRRYYGTKDSVQAIIRLNNFPNPDNIPVGTVVKLP